VGNYVAVLLQFYFRICVPANNYQNTMRFDKVIAKIEGCNFLPHNGDSISRINSIFANSIHLLRHAYWRIKLVCWL